MARRVSDVRCACWARVPPHATRFRPSKNEWETEHEMSRLLRWLAVDGDEYERIRSTAAKSLPWQSLGID